jgi:hypothetical protein
MSYEKNAAQGLQDLRILRWQRNCQNGSEEISSQFAYRSIKTKIIDAAGMVLAYSLLFLCRTESAPIQPVDLE